MFAVLSVVSAVFGIIAIGYAAGRQGYLSVDASRGIADFAFKIAIPALLFHTVVSAKFDGVAPAGVIASFFGAVGIIWLASIATTVLILGRAKTDQPSIAITATFGNTIMLGLPIGVSTFGEAALAPISAIIACHSPILLLAATLHAAATSEKGGSSVGAALMRVARQLAAQPIVVAILAALVCRIVGVPLPKPVLAMTEMLSRAGVPAALVSLGLSLAAFKVEGDMKTVGVMLLLKLLLMPAVAALLAVAFQLPPLSASVVIMMAALPAGANAYLFSSGSGRVVNAVSGAVALGTALSAISLTLILLALQVFVGP